MSVIITPALITNNKKPLDTEETNIEYDMETDLDDGIEDIIDRIRENDIEIHAGDVFEIYVPTDYGPYKFLYRFESVTPGSEYAEIFLLERPNALLATQTISEEQLDSYIRDNY